MADVERPDRGQMLVIAGLVLAVMFVRIAIILNGAIYSENLSTQESSGEGLSLSAAENLVDELDAVGLLDELEDLLDILGISNIFGSVEDDDVKELWEEAGLSGDRATGTYDLVVDSRNVDEENFHEYGADDGPRQRTIVTSGQLEMQYRADGASLNATSVDVRWTGAEP